MTQSSKAAYPESLESSNENSVNVSAVCTRCDGTGFVLVRNEAAKRLDAYRCQCSRPRQEVRVRVRSTKMLAAGDDAA